MGIRLFIFFKWIVAETLNACREAWFDTLEQKQNFQRTRCQRHSAKLIFSHQNLMWTLENFITEPESSSPSGNSLGVTDLFRNYTIQRVYHLDDFFRFFWCRLSFFFSSLDLYHAYRNLDTSSLHDSNNINQNFSSQPYFDFSAARNVTTRVGQTAFLHCRVEQLSDKLVRFFTLASFTTI